jgi:hypothetical protein
MHGTASLSLARRCHATGAFTRRCLTIVVVPELAHCGAPYVLEDDMPDDGLVTPMPEQLSDFVRALDVIAGEQ